jgi:hypothetical protein
MNTSKVIARIDVIFQLADGTRTRGELSIGFPTLRPDGFWHCPVSPIPSLQSPDGPGADSLQSLCNAIAVLKQMLHLFVETGGRILVEMQVNGQIEERELRLSSYFRALE